MNWRPEPMAAIELPFVLASIRSFDQRGNQRSLLPKTLRVQVESRYLDPEDNELTQRWLAVAAARLKEDVTTRLVLEGRVADQCDWGVRLRLEAEMRTWPAVPGITTTAEYPYLEI